ncbi:MAG: DNA repair protein RecO [Burkholderiaceae bacterium]
MNDAGIAGRPAARARRASDVRVDQQPGFVLHAYPWRETSQIVEVLTRDFGRVALVARGAKRPTSQFRGLLAPFCPLALSWSGRNEIKSLVRAEWCGGLAPLRGDALLAAFYLNELLVRLVARGDPHEGLFSSYVHTLHVLAGDDAAGAADRQSALREFELDLLRETGYAPAFDRCSDGAPIDAAARYWIDGQHGVRRVAPGAGYGHAPDDLQISGATVLALARRDFSDPRAASEAKVVLRQLIRYHLNGKPLNTRRILQDLRQL